jgi:ABC-type transporter Mla MlaB component
MRGVLKIHRHAGLEMNIESGNGLKMLLDGDWSMSGVADRFPALTGCFATLLDSGVQQKCSAGAVPEIDLAGVSEFDACGCQLLALLIRTLKQNGISAQLINLSDAFRSKIHMLGFDRELNLSL